MIFVNVFLFLMFLLIAVWWVADFLIPLFRGRPIFTMFKKTKEDQIDQMIVKENQTSDEIEKQQKLIAQQMDNQFNQAMVQFFNKGNDK